MPENMYTAYYDGIFKRSGYDTLTYDQIKVFFSYF